MQIRLLKNTIFHDRIYKHYIYKHCILYEATSHILRILQWIHRLCIDGRSSKFSTQRVLRFYSKRFQNEIRLLNKSFIYLCIEGLGRRYKITQLFYDCSFVSAMVKELDLLLSRDKFSKPKKVGKF